MFPVDRRNVSECCYLSRPYCRSNAVTIQLWTNEREDDAQAGRSLRCFAHVQYRMRRKINAAIENKLCQSAADWCHHCCWHYATTWGNTGLRCVLVVFLYFCPTATKLRCRKKDVETGEELRNTRSQRRFYSFLATLRDDVGIHVK